MHVVCPMDLEQCVRPECGAGTCRRVPDSILMVCEHWNPREFKDTYHDDLMKRIKEKVRNGETREITVPGVADDTVARSA